MKYQIARISGDGIGPEIIEQGTKILDAIGQKFQHDFLFKDVEMGACCIDKHGEPITDEGLEVCRNSDAVLFGAIGHPKYDNDPNAKVRPEQGLLRMRKELGLHTNIRPIPIFDSIKSASPIKPELLEDVDFVIFRELIGGIYFGEKKSDENSASDLCSYDVNQIESIAHLAFKSAQNRRKKLTLVDKANVLETSRLWRKTIQNLSTQFPDVEVDYLFVDNCAMQVVQNPKQFDVILTENMFGDIISDLASVIPGSIGVLPSASIGKETGVFEPIHGSYPEGAGKNIANPIATILSVAEMLKYLNLYEEAKEVEKAVDWALENNIVTPDIDAKSSFGTNEVGDLIQEYILENGLVEIKMEYLKIAENSII